MIRNNAGGSSYFGGGYREYGLYQWNVKHYGFATEFEIEAAQLWALGEHVPMKGSNGRQFETISEIVGRPVEAYLSGRSGGWLAIHTELTKAELRKVDRHVKACLKGLPEFLKSEREFRASEAKAEADAEAKAQAEAEAKIKARAEALRDLGFAKDRLRTGLKYGPDMRTSTIVCVQDAIELVGKALDVLKGGE